MGSKKRDTHSGPFVETLAKSQTKGVAYAHGFRHIAYIVQLSVVVVGIIRSAGGLGNIGMGKVAHIERMDNAAYGYELLGRYLFRQPFLCQRVNGKFTCYGVGP